MSYLRQEISIPRADDGVSDGLTARRSDGERSRYALNPRRGGGELGRVGCRLVVTVPHVHSGHPGTSCAYD